MNKYLLALFALSAIFIVGCSSQVSTVVEGAATGNYVRYDKTHYEKSLSEDKVILLDFYANWCPICRLENPKIRAGLDELNDPNVQAYQVHYNDGDTNEDDEALSREFGITVQHTKVILKNGEVQVKSLESWSKERTISELKEVL